MLITTGLIAVGGLCPLVCKDTLFPHLVVLSVGVWFDSLVDLFLCGDLGRSIIDAPIFPEFLIC